MRAGRHLDPELVVGGEEREERPPQLFRRDVHQQAPARGFGLAAGPRARGLGVFCGLEHGRRHEGRRARARRHRARVVERQDALPAALLLRDLVPHLGG